ncbi:hypothetical protein GJAV_G00144700 [Gymnothorax javanicus]|nr:hypothetical protein GJAV_G00144700 [Gymnothorax javanicus]
MSARMSSTLSLRVRLHTMATPLRKGYHHSLPSSPYSSGPEGQRLPPSGAVSSEFLNHGGSTKILLLICNTAGVGQQAVRFGPPFLMREDMTISWEQLQQSILNKMCYLMINGAPTQNFGMPFRIRVVGGSASYSYLSPQDGRPLFHPAVDRALKLCGPGGPPHVKLIIEWEHKVKECLFGNIQEEVVKDAESVRIQHQQHLQQYSCTLDECFQLYTKEEQLAPDDAWKCPHCKKPQQGTVKMSLWTLPDILILHLKRFRQVNERRHKLSTLVRFPLAGLDMAPHVVKRSQSLRTLGPWPPAWKQHPPRSPDSGPSPNFLYDLYAVCNHHGGMHGGHYTAYCRNSVDGLWYGYDDCSVDLVPEEELCTRGAYILFYQRRNAIPPWSASSSIRGSTSSSMSDHWLIRLTGDSKRGSFVSRASTTCPSSAPDSPESPVFQEEPPKEEKGGFEPRPFVRGLQGRSVSMRTPTKTRDAISKVLPLRWSFGSRDRRKPAAEPAPARPHGELVEYLESGRRPRCTKDPIVALVSGPPEKDRATVSSPSSSSSLSCLGRAEGEPRGAGRAPEGQYRQLAESSGSALRHGAGRQRDDSTLSRRSSRKSKPEQSSVAADSHPHRSSGSAAPGGSDSTLRRAKGHQGPGDRGCVPEESRGKRGEGPESLLSLLKPGFLKKDSHRKQREGEEPRPAESAKRTSSRQSLSNGAASGATDSRANGAPRGTGSRSRCGQELANGRLARGPADIKRSQSSSNIPTKQDLLTLRRTTSLQKNGLSAAPPRGLTADKPSYATLQRVRYSTTSLGRKRTVPESSF